MGPIQPAAVWMLGAVFLTVKQLGHDADHLPPFFAKVKNVWSCIFHSFICPHGLVLIQCMLHLQLNFNLKSAPVLLASHMAIQDSPGFH